MKVYNDTFVILNKDLVAGWLIKTCLTSNFMITMQIEYS